MNLWEDLRDRQANLDAIVVNDGHKDLAMPDVKPTIRPAKLADVMLPALISPQTGLFWNAQPETLDRVVSKSWVLHVLPSALLFSQGQSTDSLPLFVVLTGAFEVRHRLDSGTLIVARDGPGVVIGEVEMFVRDIGPDITARGDMNTAMADIVAVEASDVLAINPPSTIFETRDFQVALNMSKLLSIKLLRRNAWLDTSLVRKPIIEIYRYLRELASRTNGVRPLGRDHVELVASQTQSQVANRLNIKRQTLNSAVRHKMAAQGLTWESGNIKMTRRFYERLLEDPVSLAREGRITR